MTSYSYKVQAVDIANNVSAFTAALSVTTVQDVFSPGFARAEYFTGAGGVSVDDLRAMQKFIDNRPDQVQYRLGFESQTGFGDNYGGRLSGLVTPTVSGNYIFFISADDHAELWLSTDDKPATVALIASEPDWAGEREWTGNAGAAAAIRRRMSRYRRL